MDTTDEYVISPPTGFPRIDAREMWRYRDLLIVLAWRDIAVRYKQTALGILWALLQPFISMIVFTFVFNRMGRIQSGDGTPYPIFLYVGLLLWQFHSNAILGAANSMVSNAGLVQKVYFPRLFIPATAIITGLVDLAIAGAILVGLMAYYGYHPQATGLLVLPVLLASLILASLGIGFFAAAVNVKYRDVRHALPFVVQTMMFVTPVIWPVKMLDSHPIARSLMIWLNPASGIISNARAGILGQSPVDWGILGISALVSLVFFVCGISYFRGAERYLADVL